MLHSELGVVPTYYYTDGCKFGHVKNGKLHNNVSKREQYRTLENIVRTRTCAMHASILSTHSNNAIQMLQLTRLGKTWQRVEALEVCFALE
jgi:hypothetical protein